MQFTCHRVLRADRERWVTTKPDRARSKRRPPRRPAIEPPHHAGPRVATRVSREPLREIPWQLPAVLLSLPRPMISLRAILTVAVCSFLFSFSLRAQSEPGLDIQSDSSTFQPATGTATGTGNVVIKYRGSVL